MCCEIPRIGYAHRLFCPRPSAILEGSSVGWPIDPGFMVRLEDVRGVYLWFIPYTSIRRAIVATQSP